MINTRFLDIIRLLLKQDDYITINEISKQLNVSNKTIRNDLVQIGEWLHENNLELIKKTGVGVTISGDKNTKLHVYQEISEKNSKNLDYSPEARKIYIGMKLILNPKCRIYELAEDLFVSRATIHKDILALIPFFDQYKIKLNRKNNNGISIEGKEKYYRDMLFDLMKKDNGYAVFSDIVKMDDYSCDGSFPFAALDINDDEIAEFMQVLKKSHSEYLHSLQFTSLVQVILRLLISYVRIHEGHYITLSDEFISEIHDLPNYETAKLLCTFLNEHYKLDIPDMEIRYLQVFLISLQNSEDSSTYDLQEAEEITFKMLTEWEKSLHYPFCEDQELYKAVLQHLFPAITRFKHGISIENPLMYDIKTIYANTFQITKLSMHVIEEKLNCKVSDEEIGFFTLHLAAALDRMKQPLNTVVISNTRSGATNLLVRKLSSQFRELDIRHTTSFGMAHEYNYENIDLIISTTDISLNTEIPVIVINPLLYDHDILRLKSIVKTHFAKKNDPILHH